MPAPNVISADKLLRLIGTPTAPRIIDIRSSRDATLPGSRLRHPDDVDRWGDDGDGPAVILCADGALASPGVAGWLRARGVSAEVLEGGAAAWEAAGYPLVPESALPARDNQGRTRWVTRARPKVDRIACPWLIRRFVDPEAVFLFVAPGDVARVSEQTGAAPFDVDGVVWSHRGEKCTFDAMVEDLCLARIDALTRLAVIVRGADTGHPEIAPQAAGLLATSLGLSRMFSDDRAQLDAGMLIYDALYRWCRDAVDETHDWQSHQSKGKARS